VQDIQDYIESGILEQYALGELSPAEQAAVEAQAARYPEVQRELSEVMETLGFYAEAHAVTPPAGLRERVLPKVLSQIGEAPAAGSHLHIATNEQAPNPVAAEPVNPTREAVVRPLVTAPMDEASARRTGWTMAASVALLLSLAGNALLYTRWQDASQEVVALQNDQARIAAATQVVEKRLDVVSQQNTVLRSDEFKAVALAGTPAAPSARARVLFNPGTRQVYVDVRNLPALPAGKQYQLWALDKGKPVDAGVLAAATAAGDSLQQMKDIASAQAFAMTVEPAGGSTNPTLTTMTVIGNI
jgi:anti-sigma-K factor RskA